MFSEVKKYLLLIALIIMFLPITVFADSDVEVSQDNDTIVEESNDLLLNSNDDDLNKIREIIGQEIDVDLVESQSYDFVIDGEDYYSVLDTAVSEVVLDKMKNSNFDYLALGYTFVPDCVRYNGFDYNGTIAVYKGDSLVDSISITIIYLNSNQHTQIEQDYVDDFVSSNEFYFEEEIYLEDYSNVTFNLDEELNDFSDDYGILCKSMLPPFSGVSYDFLYACFYNDKYYSSLIANHGISTIVTVPGEVVDQESYALNEVKDYFVGYFEELGIDDIVTNESMLFFSGDYIYSDDICLGKFVIKVEPVIEPEPVPGSMPELSPVVNPAPYVEPAPINNQQEAHYSSLSYRTYYTRYCTNYYSSDDTGDFEDSSQTGSTLGEDNIIDVSDIIDSKNKIDEVKSKTTTKTKENKIIKKTDLKNEKESFNRKDINVKNLLFIVLSSIILIGIIIAIINKLFIRSEI